MAVTATPFSTTLDTTEATTDAVDAELHAFCPGAPAMDASVWYDFTAPADGFYVADVSTSDYTAGVFVATGAPGSFDVLACAPGGAAFEATAGQTYHLLVIDDQSDGAGNGGTMSLTLDVAPPPPTLDVTVNPTGWFDSKTGLATISGTITCSPDAGAALIETQLTQRVGRMLIRGFAWGEEACDDTTHVWSVDVAGDNGLFKGGKAANVTFSVACGLAFCSEYFSEQTIQLKGKR